jgi:hypothetical protein
MGAVLASLGFAILLAVTIYMLVKVSRMLDESRGHIRKLAESLDSRIKAQASPQYIEEVKSLIERQQNIHYGLRLNRFKLQSLALAFSSAIFIILNLIFLANVMDPMYDNYCQCTMVNRVDDFFVID